MIHWQMEYSWSWCLGIPILTIYDLCHLWDTHLSGEWVLVMQLGTPLH